MAGVIYKSLAYVQNWTNSDWWKTFRPMAFQECLKFAIACCHGPDWLVTHICSNEVAPTFTMWLAHILTKHIYLSSHTVLGNTKTGKGDF